MKKIFLIIFFSFFFSTVSNSKIYKLEKCYSSYSTVNPSLVTKKFDNDVFEKFNIFVDTEKKKIQSTIIFTDKYFELSKKNNTNKKNVTKIYTSTEDITYIDEKNNYFVSIGEVKLMNKIETLRTSINYKNKTVIVEKGKFIDVLSCEQ
jgi:hypothetical protein